MFPALLKVKVPEPDLVTPALLLRAPDAVVESAMVKVIKPLPAVMAPASVPDPLPVVVIFTGPFEVVIVPAELPLTPYPLRLTAPVLVVRAALVVIVPPPPPVLAVSVSTPVPLSVMVSLLLMVMLL